MGRVAALPLLICRNLVVLFMLFIVGCFLFHAQMAEARLNPPILRSPQASKSPNLRCGPCPPTPSPPPPPGDPTHYMDPCCT